MSDQATIWRWREAFQNDFAARMDRTIRDYYAHANHNPKLSVNGDDGKGPILVDAEVGQPVTLDASRSSDPDRQNLHFVWFHYAEAGGTGTNLADVKIGNDDAAVAHVTPTAVYRAQWLPNRQRCVGSGVAHVILAVTDEGSPKLSSYRRIVLTVRPSKTK
jgi:hypothetical protein